MADEPDRYPDSAGPFAGPNNTFPIKDKAHVENAWARIHQGPTRANHSAAEIADIIGKIQARAKELGITLEAHASRSLEGDTVERRAVLMPVELRALPDGPEGSRMIGGYAAVFNRDSRMIPGAMGSSFIERVTPGFFEEARTAGWPGNQGSGVMCRYNHNDQYLLGTTQAATCQLTVDRTGLEYRAEVPRCRDDVLELVGRGDIRQSSFTFMDAEDDWNYTGGITHRTLISGGVLDVAPVSAVAGYQDTTVGMRSLAAFKDVPVDDVFALAQRDELRQLFIRTDKAMAVSIGDGKEEERNVATDTPAEPAEQLALDVADTETPTEPVAEPSEAAPLEWEPPTTLGHREARLHLLSRRPYDPIIKVTPKGNITS
jgi:HK97 family phage prohead protease